MLAECVKYNISQNKVYRKKNMSLLNMPEKLPQKMCSGKSFQDFWRIVHTMVWEFYTLRMNYSKNVCFVAQFQSYSYARYQELSTQLYNVQ